MASGLANVMQAVDGRSRSSFHFLVTYECALPKLNAQINEFKPRRIAMIQTSDFLALLR